MDENQLNRSVFALAQMVTAGDLLDSAERITLVTREV